MDTSQQLSFLPGTHPSVRSSRKPRPRDPSWEALIRVTDANPRVERVILNMALKAIREASKTDGTDEEALPAEILRRADLYRQRFPTMMLTPMALAKHWRRVVTQTGSGTSSTVEERTLARLRSNRSVLS